MGRSDRHVENTRMNPENQAWQPIDPAAGSLPAEIDSALDDGDSVSACVVILVDSEIDRDWGAQASFAVAKRWAASGRRIILADACLDDPVLHEVAGVENGEGVSDMVLYGASAPRITERVEDGLMLAPAGTPVTEVADVLEHAKWDMVIRGCREAGATLVFHVSTGTPGVEAMTKRAEGVLVLAPPSKDVNAILGSESGPLIAVLGPANGDAPPVVSEDPGGDVAAVDVAPGLPDTVDDDALSAEALPGLPEVGAPAVEAPAVEAPVGVPTDDPSETSDVLSVSGLEGAQYDSEDSPEVGLDPGQAPPSPDEAEIAASLDVELPTLADAEGESTGDLESAGADATDTSDFAALDLEAADPADSGSGAVVGPGEPALAPDALPEPGAEDSAAEVGFAAAFGVEVAPTQERGEAAETKGKAPQGYRGLARLRRQKRRDLFVRLMLFVIATSVVGGGGFLGIAYFGLINVPGVTPPDRVRVASSYVPPPVVLPGSQTEIMRYALLLDLSFDIESPLSTANALRGRLPNLLFFVTPLDVNGRLQFALHAGPAYSVAEATALKGPIAVSMDRENPDDWLVRDAPYAFYFGEYTSAVNAQGRIQALARASIPAYSLQVVLADGTTRERVYGGAFRDELEAEEMGRMINDADIGELVLTSRRGIVPE